MRTYKNICFKHRYVSDVGSLCPTCRVQLYCIGDRIPVPKKNDDAGWKDLLKFLQTTRHATFDVKTNRMVNKQSIVNRIDQSIADSIGKRSKK